MLQGHDSRLKGNWSCRQLDARFEIWLGHIALQFWMPMSSSSFQSSHVTSPLDVLDICIHSPGHGVPLCLPQSGGSGLPQALGIWLPGNPGSPLGINHHSGEATTASSTHLLPASCGPENWLATCCSPVPFLGRLWAMGGFAASSATRMASLRTRARANSSPVNNIGELLTAGLTSISGRCNPPQPASANRFGQMEHLPTPTPKCDTAVGIIH